MVPRNYVHFLLILSELLIMASMIIIIFEYYYRDWNKEIWIGSKILTMKNIMKDNNNNLYPLLSYDTNANYKYSYSYLLQHSGKYCKVNYKKCGILDTYGNIMCIPKEDECPINDLIVDLPSKCDEYYSKGYLISESLLGDKAIYYTNKAINNPIVAKIKNSETVPRYISKENFIFDNDIYEESIDTTPSTSSSGSSGRNYGGGGWGGGGGGGGGGAIGGGGGGFRNLKYGSYEVDDYIKNKFMEVENIDKSFRLIYKNLYIGNYIGFKDYLTLKKYENYDLHNVFFKFFPHKLMAIFGIIFLIVLFGIMIFSITRCFHKDTPNEGYNKEKTKTAKCWIICLYSLIYIISFIYTTIEFSYIYNKDRLCLTKIDADKFIENFLKEVKNTSLLLIFILLILLYIISLGLFIFGWYLSYIYTKRYLELL